MGKIVLSAVSNAEEAARRIDRQLAVEAAELAAPDDDFDLILDNDEATGWDDDSADAEDTADAAFAIPALQEIAADRRRGWGNYADLRPHPMMTPPPLPPRDPAVQVA